MYSCIQFFFFQRSRQGPKGVLVSGYNLIQKVALGLEVVVRNLQLSNSQYATKSGNFWQLSYQQSNRIVESLFILLKSLNFPAENLPLVARSTVPPNVACMNENPNEALSDLRDWVILHDSMSVIDFYLKMFKAYKIHLARNLVERATYDVRTGETRRFVDI